jgi:hypothetical protein
VIFLDPISVFTGVGIEAAAAKNSVTMRVLALSIAKANTRAGEMLSKPSVFRLEFLSPTYAFISSLFRSVPLKREMIL